VIFICQEEEFNWKTGDVVLYFYFPNMPYHKLLLGAMDKIEKMHKGIRILGIDVEYFSVLCRRFEIKSAPTTLLIKEGKEIKRIVGLIDDISYLMGAL